MAYITFIFEIYHGRCENSVDIYLLYIRYSVKTYILDLCYYRTLENIS